jgi:protein-L-isoaspartate(D-aspartate) O-methyltransferase
VGVTLFEIARAQMVAEQIAGRGVRDPRVVAAMGKVPRERFVPPNLAGRAYEDAPLPIGQGQTISQPYIVARVAELARLTGVERVLEVGVGSGYLAAILAHLAGEVHAIDILPEMVERAQRNLGAAGIGNVRVTCGDGSTGWPEHAPYDAILVSAGAPRLPVLLLGQLAEGGRLVAPVGPRAVQRLVRLIRRGDDYVTEEDIAVRFVDLIGEYGWGGRGPIKA